MPAQFDDDGSEDVNDFLQRIRELGDQRDKEDEERNRKLEEEIIQGRKERQARRAAAENIAAKPLGSKTEPVISSEGDMNKDNIAQSLASKDPFWFKQTQDRGLGSAAFRKSQERETSDTKPAEGGVALPGMAKNTNEGPRNRQSPPPESTPSASPSTESSMLGTSGSGSKRTGSTTASSVGGVRSALPTMSSQKLQAPSSNASSTYAGEGLAMDRGLAMSPAQGRLSAERMDRPTSPTKGLGGFVQSAMMKRSDSVNKRWSAQAMPGLSRGNSVASNRSGYDHPKFPIGGIASLGEPKPAKFSRDSTPASTSSRPGSSQSNTTIRLSLQDDDRPTAVTSGTSNRSNTPPNTLLQEQHHHQTPTAESKPLGVMNPPTSPSKRWSPQKSSWLENAINKPESPRVLSPAATAQPPLWMAGIARAKQQRSSVDSSKDPDHKRITTDGSMRSLSPDMEARPPNIGRVRVETGTSIVTKPDSITAKKVEKVKDTPTSGDHGKSDSITCAKSDPPQQIHDSKDPPKAAAKSDNTSKPDVLDHKDGGTSNSSPKPLTIKPKPETPPKKDLKASLRPRPTSTEARNVDEPEFKNVFGKLKRTQTQNYKAPDEFKSNIMRGKAGLIATGGPKKTEHKDELKESILRKKQGMVAPSASTRITSASSKATEDFTPEALKKRQGLARVNNIGSNGSVELAEDEGIIQPETLARLPNLRSIPVPVVSKKPNVAPADTKNNSNPNLGTNFASSLAGILQRGPPPISVPSENYDSSLKGADIKCQSTDPAGQEDEPKAGPQLTHATRGRARGPKRRLPTASQTTEVMDESRIGVETSLTNSASEKKPLSPKIAPKAQNAPIGLTKSEPRPLSNITNCNNNNRRTSQASLSSRTKPPKPTLPATPPQHSEETSKQGPMTKSKPPSPIMGKLREASAPALQNTSRSPSKATSSDQKEKPPFSTLSTQENETPLIEVVASLRGKLASSSQHAPSNLPVKLPMQTDREAVPQQAGLEMAEIGCISIQSSPNTILSRLPEPNVLTSSANSPRSPPLPGKKPTSITERAASNTLQSPLSPSTTSQKSKTSVLAQFFADIFDELPRPEGSIKTDTQSIIDTRSTIDCLPKIKTLRKQILEVIENGKTKHVPPHQEHILFEDSLYLCTHVFGTPAGQRTTEVYLWCGDSASPSAADDAQLFARKVAKDCNGKLITMKQGKESSAFFQALGGIVITRRGSRNTSESATYMLCGRQHLGQIAFDEVNFGPQSLRSGFPYIVSAPSAKLYLWKGKGAGADELGCARLIGMDLGLTGEIEEIEEDREPEAFWAAFPSGASRMASMEATGQHWRLKPSCEKYATRLFSVDTEGPRPKSASSFMQWGRRGSAPSNDANGAMTAQIREIIPFSHADMVLDQAYVLDAFFEIFVYAAWPVLSRTCQNTDDTPSILSLPTLQPPPHRRSSKSASFRAALLFAQEYGILAASVEDRPFVPHSSVVLLTKDGKSSQEVPEELRWAFRKWDDSRVDGCKVLGLSEALEGMGASR
ncbi:MAG: hypothetical protein Q9163_001180 [Psora crenata]